jgi:hypothetical protein
MLQIATPYSNDEDIEGSLDLWITRIRERYPQNNVTWLSGGKAKKGTDQTGSTGIPAMPSGPDLSMYDMSDIKKKLAEAGLPESLIGLFSDADLVENARSMGLLDKKPEAQPDAQPEAPPETKPETKPDAKPDAKGKKKGG